jgi:hypothetical protein
VWSKTVPSTQRLETYAAARSFEDWARANLGAWLVARADHSEEGDHRDFDLLPESSSKTPYIDTMPARTEDRQSPSYFMMRGTETSRARP